LRLAVVSPFVDRCHGTERALAELLERLARAEHCEIHLYAHRVEDLALDRPGVPRLQESGAIFWHKVPSPPGPHLLKFVLWLFLNSFCRAWDRLVHGLHFDLVLSPGINCFDADAIIVHVLFHRLRELARAEQGEASRPGFFRRLHRRAYYALLTAMERRIYADPGVFLGAVSSRTARLLAGIFHREDVRVISNGVDTVKFSPSARLTLRAGARRRRNFREHDFVLLLIGNDWRVKGLATILEALAALHNSACHLIIAGEDSPDSFHASARRFDISDRCRFEPPRPDVLDLYAAADLYVSPSHEDSFGLPVAEAMASGLPVVTSAFAGVADLIRDGIDGFILQDPADFQALARILQLLQADAALRNKMGEAAAKAVQQWTWDRNAAEVWELLKAAAAGKLSRSARKN
jgi:UDP-glucose:(heptosyl)LPS alpha-1,3-glucosyltransferase